MDCIWLAVLAQNSAQHCGNGHINPEEGKLEPGGGGGISQSSHCGGKRS